MLRTGSTNQTGNIGEGRTVAPCKGQRGGVGVDSVSLRKAVCQFGGNSEYWMGHKRGVGSGDSSVDIFTHQPFKNNE